MADCGELLNNGKVFTVREAAEEVAFPHELLAMQR